MTEENLLNLRNRYQQLNEVNKNLEKMLSIKEELETNEVVKEYKKLLDTLDIYQKEFPISKGLMTNDELLEKVMDEEYITNTNRIYVYQCSYAKKYYRKTKQNIDYYRVAVDDSRAEYHVYLDIEKELKSAQIEIPASERETFEKENSVIYPVDAFPYDFYQNKRKIFFETALNESQEVAIQKVLKK